MAAGFNNGSPVTTSMKVAEYFGKRHDDVLKSVRNLLEDKDIISRRNFAESDYTDERGKTQPMYELDRDGFTLLAMGFTGKKTSRGVSDNVMTFNGTSLHRPFSRGGLMEVSPQGMAAWLVLTWC